MWKSMETYDATKGTKPSTYALQAARWRMDNAARNIRKHAVLPVDPADLRDDLVGGPDVDLDLRLVVRRAVARLPQKQREAILRHFWLDERGTVGKVYGWNGSRTRLRMYLVASGYPV